MNLLRPSEAAAIARGVYRLREDSVSTVRQRGQALGCEDMFSVADNSRFEGRSGALAWKKLSGFGYVADGEGRYAGEVLLVTRGTATGLDWLSNLNIGFQPGPASLPVHAGFNEVWKSFAPEVRQFMRGRNPSRIHCVGHSLGGALAALNADLLSAGNVADVVLYTFGSPRVGDGFFAKSLTRRVGGDQIYRVSHPADPVPMIPLFPFWHLPFGRQGLQIAATSKALIAVSAHGMEASYIPGVLDQSWATLQHGEEDANEGRHVQGWLEQLAEGRGSFLMGSATLLHGIGRALGWLLSKAGKLVMGGLGVALAASATLLDHLAWLLSKATQLSRELGSQVKGLLKAIWAFLGRKAVAAVELTTAFLRWVLELLFASLRNVAARALALVA